MSEEIIIDGVNVAECGFYHPEYDNYCHIALAFSEDYGECLECQDNPDCYYKQLQRLKQENKILKERKDKYYLLTLDYEAKISYLVQALEEIRDIAKEATNSKDCYIYMYAGRMYCEPILKKIDEVLNDRD